VNIAGWSRAAAALMLSVGVVMGTASGGTAYRPPARSGDDFMLEGDFHVHAAPGDGSLTPAELRDEAARAGLDVIAITNHNQFVAARLARALPADRSEPIVLPGEEITHPDYHLIAVGLEHPVPADLSVVDAIAAIHAQGGVAIAAHPGRAFTAYDDAALAVVDGTEVAHPERKEKYRRQYIEKFVQARRVNPHVAPIGSSDVHNSPVIGECRTFIFARERSARGVLDAIRGGRTVAIDARGRLFGDPDLVERVRRTPHAAPTDPYPVWRRAAVVLTYVGIVGVMVL